MIEGRGEIDLPEVLVGTDAIELDQLVLARFGLERPEYIRRLAAGTGSCESHPSGSFV
jgi:hypothetical protein